MEEKEGVNNNVLVKVSRGDNVVFGGMERNAAEILFEALENDNTVTGMRAFEADTVPFEELPENVKIDVKNKLRAYDRCNVVYSAWEFHVSPNYAIKATYLYDEVWCGEYFAKDVFTEDERRENFVKVFGYEPRVKMW